MAEPKYKVLVIPIDGYSLVESIPRDEFNPEHQWDYCLLYDSDLPYCLGFRVPPKVFDLNVRGSVLAMDDLCGVVMLAKVNVETTYSVDCTADDLKELLSGIESLGREEYWRRLKQKFAFDETESGLHMTFYGAGGVRWKLEAVMSCYDALFPPPYEER